MARNTTTNTGAATSPDPSKGGELPPQGDTANTAAATAADTVAATAADTAADTHFNLREVVKAIPIEEVLTKATIEELALKIIAGVAEEVRYMLTCNVNEIAEIVRNDGGSPVRSLGNERERVVKVYSPKRKEKKLNVKK